MKTAPNFSLLVYTENKMHAGKLRRYYMAWRAAQSPPLPERCDNPECVFHTQQLVWNGRRLKPVLDHREGNNSDNRPHKLQLLCPNCNSQAPTHGGANKGKIEKAPGGYAIKARGPDGTVRRDYVLPPETVTTAVQGGEATFRIATAKDETA